MKAQELLKKLNELQIKQISIECCENIHMDIWEKYFKNKIRVLADNLYEDEHRWYAKGVTVFELKNFPDFYFGCKHIIRMYDEMSSVKDLDYTLEFFEMEMIQTVSYKIKNNENNSK